MRYVSIILECMPVTKTAKRALRSSKRKAFGNSVVAIKLEKALRLAKETKAAKNILEAISLADRAAKQNIIHKNKAARIKSSLSKLAKPFSKKTTSKKSSSKASGKKRK